MCEDRTASSFRGQSAKLFLFGGVQASFEREERTGQRDKATIVTVRGSNHAGRWQHLVLAYEAPATGISVASVDYQWMLS